MKRQSPPTQIEANKVILKKHDLSLAPLMFKYIDDDRARLRTYLPWVDSTKTVQDETNYIEMMSDQWAKGVLFDYGVFRKSDGVYLGNLGVHTISWPNDCCEIGYWILGKYEGHGYISDGTRALTKALFKMGFHRIEIHCSSANLKSALIPKALGFSLEGTLRDSKVEYGNYRTTLIFGKLSSD